LGKTGGHVCGSLNGQHQLRQRYLQQGNTLPTTISNK